MPRSGWAYTDLGYFNELGGMTGSVQFRTDCNSLSGSTNFVFASSSNRVGIRYDLTQPGFDIQRGSTALPLYHPNAALEVRGDMNVTGSIYAKNYYIQNVSFMDLTGSTKFGDTAGDTHKFIGKVGIGTSFETGPSSDRRDPQSLLHLEHTDTTTWPSTITASDEEYGDFLLSLRNHTDTQHAFAGISFDVTSEIDADSLGAAIVAVADNTTANVHDANLAFATNDAGDDGLTERMRITHDGKVGIGLPAPGVALEVRDGTGTAQLKLSYDASNYAHLNLNSAGSLVLSPSSEYVILDATTATYVQGDLLKVGRGTTADTTITFDGSTNDMSIVYDESAKTLAFDTDDLFIDAANGKVGIGTTTPDAPLDVKGTGAADSEVLRFSLDGDRDWSFAQEGSGAGTGLRLRSTAGKDFHVDATSIIFRKPDGSGEIMRVEPTNGKVGIGVVDPDSPLEVFSTSTQQKWSYDSNSFATFTVAASSETVLATGESGKLTLDAGGDIVLDADGDQISMKFGAAAGHIDFSNANSGDGIIRQMVDSKDLVIQQYDGSEVVRFGDDRKLYFFDKGGEYIHGDATNLTIASGNDIVCALGSGKALEPITDNISDLGSTTKRWANIYTGDLHLKNDRGDWTVVEESEYLTLVNNANGKKYKIMMEEIED